MRDLYDELQKLRDELSDSRDELSTLRAKHERLREAARAFAVDLSDNYDHCNDAHRHQNGSCRVCKADEFLSSLTESGGE